MTLSKNNIHYRCGGNLIPIEDPSWFQRTAIRATFGSHARCDQCGLAGEVALRREVLAALDELPANLYAPIKNLIEMDALSEPLREALQIPQ